MSAGFVSLRLAPIGAICPLCMMSAAATATLLLAVVVRRRGGAVAAPAAPSVRVWPATFVATMATTMLVLWPIPQLPLPGS